MKKSTRLFTAILSAALISSGAAISAGAVQYQTVSLPGCGSSCIITPNGCNTFDNADIQNIISQCGDKENCNANELQNVLENCGLLPDNNQCTDCNDIQENTQSADIPTVKSPDIQTPVTESISEYEKQVVDIVNRYRSENGLQPLTIDTELFRLARLKSQDMKDNNYFSHTSPTYGSAFDMMKKAGIKYNTAGENIAMGQQTPEAVMTAWMNSEGHRANILNSSYTKIGVGYVADGNYWTQMFIS